MSHIQLNYALLHFADAAFAALKKERMFFSKCKHFLSEHSLFFYVTHCLRTKKSTTPGNLMSETVTRKCASRDAVVLWTTLPLAEASTEMTIEASNPAHPESPRAFYISLLCIILCYKNARNSFIYRALRAI